VRYSAVFTKMFPQFFEFSFSKKKSLDIAVIFVICRLLNCWKKEYSTQKEILLYVYWFRECSVRQNIKLEEGLIVLWLIDCISQNRRESLVPHRNMQNFCAVYTRRAFRSLNFSQPCNGYFFENSWYVECQNYRNDTRLYCSAETINVQK
jgi:hypothetical protein